MDEPCIKEMFVLLLLQRVKTPDSIRIIVHVLSIFPHLGAIRKSKRRKIVATSSISKPRGTLSGNKRYIDSLCHRLHESFSKQKLPKLMRSFNPIKINKIRKSICEIKC